MTTPAKNVLVVDDAAFVRASLRIMLEKNGFKIIAEAENGVVAVHKYRELKPDIVTMDITMPFCDGIRAVQMIREVDPNAVIIMVTSMGQDAHVREAVKAGAKGFIVKPFVEEYVIKTLKKFWGFTVTLPGSDSSDFK